MTEFNTSGIITPDIKTLEDAQKLLQDSFIPYQLESNRIVLYQGLTFYQRSVLGKLNYRNWPGVKYGRDEYGKEYFRER